MTRLFNDPTHFRDELIEGFVAAHRGWVRAVPGGVARSTKTPDGQVAVINGGGSGHYPTFAGLVGPGMMSGAVMGDLFASPSAQQVVSVTRNAEHGGGVLYVYCNYAGDCLNFDQGAERVETDGIPTRSVVVTDDITSAGPAEKDKRRGIGGALAVFKTAGAAAASGAELERVTELAARANARTRSIGVALSGCTLPGADAPLFTLPPGRMGVGIGIHGEPGLREEDIPSADGLAEFFVSELLAELPEGVEVRSGTTVVPLLNSLGTIRFEEMFVVYRRVAALLADQGLEVVEPEVGDLCSSFDMAGISLSLFWPDDELERLWRAPADSPAFRKGTMAPVEPLSAAEAAIREPGAIGAGPENTASEVSQRAAETVLAALRAMQRAIEEQTGELGRLDAVAGDGDHGIGMRRGVTAAAAAAEEAKRSGAGAGTVLEFAADAWADKAGGTSGALWGALLHRFGRAIGDQEGPDLEVTARAVGEAAEAVQAFGKAEAGDKTMLDALIPFADTLNQAAVSAVSAVDASHASKRSDADGVGRLSIAWARAAEAAAGGAEHTRELLPRIGRARPHAEKSLGSPDAGAVSFALIVRAVAEVLAAQQQD